MSDTRMCVNCGKTVTASHPRHKPIPECVGPDGLSACTFDATPDEAWQIWRDRCHELRKELATACAQIERLKDAAQCACAYDYPSDMCAVHCKIRDNFRAAGRLEGLEEAAKIVAAGMGMTGVGAEIASRICALKDRQP